MQFQLKPLSQLLATSAIALSVHTLPVLADSTLALGSVTVTGEEKGPLSSYNILSSVDYVGSDVLEKQPVQYSWELFSRVPGVMLTQFNQGTTSGKLSFRGFRSEEHTSELQPQFHLVC